MTTPAGTLPEEIDGELRRLRESDGNAEYDRHEANLRTAILAALAACKRETARECAEWVDAEARDCGCADRIKARIAVAFGLTGEEA